MKKPEAERPALTKRQQEIFEFLKEKIMNRGYGPTIREIGTQFGIKSPNGVICHLKALEKKGFITREPHMSRAIQLADSPADRMSIPLAGQISAGKPLLAEEWKEKVDFASLFDPETHFCLKVKGDSMIEAQIADGDYVVVRRQNTARNGDITVALVDDSDATLNRFYKEKKRIRLEPAHKKMKPIFSTNVKVLGVVSGVIRRYK